MRGVLKDDHNELTDACAGRIFFMKSGKAFADSAYNYLTWHKAASHHHRGKSNRRIAARTGRAELHVLNLGRDRNTSEYGTRRNDCTLNIWAGN